MKPTAQFTPPPQPEPGVVTITMDAGLANKLRALLGACNSCVFDSIYNALDQAFDVTGAPEKLKLEWIPPSPLDSPFLTKSINLHSGFKFVPY